MEKFKNEVVLDFNHFEHERKQKHALNNVRSLFGMEYTNLIGGKEVRTDNKTHSYSPSNTNILIGIFQKAGKDGAEEAMQAALAAFETWKYVPAEKRASYLFKVADLIKKRRYEINAWMILESGKNFTEADADTCEAIDFLEFYGREAIRYSKNQKLTANKGEKNNYFYIPLGVGIVIPPWNFPFAILVGTAAASIVSGNTIVLKPSSETPMMGYIFAELMQEVGLPDGVLNFLVASGAEAGDYLVEHPKTRFISFTGSMEVGIGIYEKAAKVNPGQIWLKRVVAEMGGKDAILADYEVNVDDLVSGVVAASFGFQGQKCSACSRVIVDAKIYDEFVSKLQVKVAEIQVGDPAENFPAGPVISEKAYKSILNYIEIGKTEGRLLNGGGKVEGLNGWYIQPTVFVDVPETARIANEEIFGPVLAVIKSNDLEHGIKIFNSTIYGLTGAFYSNNPEKVKRGIKELHCGNLYLNRKCTGALVDVHPFGGFNMSGTDSKAGSRDYLMLFMQGKATAEKIRK